MDLAVVRFLAEHRWEPLTLVMSAASAWWFRTLLMVGLGFLADLRAPWRLPWIGGAALAAYWVAHLLSQAGKDLTDRPRPSVRDPSITVVGDLPTTSAMPSSHAATAFAIATVVAMLHPRLRWPLLGLATLVSVSRVYLGVHHPSDVLVGALLGVLVGGAIALALRRVPPYSTSRPSSRAASA